MKRSNLYSFLLLLLIYIALVSFPFERFISNVVDLYLIKIILEIAFSTFIFIYIGKRGDYIFKRKKFNGRNLLLCLPTVIVCFSNFAYFLFRPEYFIGFYYDIFFTLEVILNVFIALHEELIFRAILITNFEFMNNKFKVFMSALIFSFSHIVNFLVTFQIGALLQLVYTFLLGVLLGIIYVSTNSIIPCVVFHFLFNTFNNVVFNHCGGLLVSLPEYLIANGIVVAIIAIYLVVLQLIHKKKGKFNY